MAKVKIKTGYKLFEMDFHGNLHPLKVDKSLRIKPGFWYTAHYMPTKNVGGIHPGWGVVVKPEAEWLKDENGNYTSERKKSWKRVWCEVSYVSTIDRTKTITPEEIVHGPGPDEYYQFWDERLGVKYRKCGRIKVNKILTEKERLDILNKKKEV